MDELGTTGGLIAPALPGAKHQEVARYERDVVPGGLIAPALLGGFGVVGNPADWLVTGLNNRTPVLSPLGELKSGLLEIFECGGCYRQDGVGFLVGAPGVAGG
jgi:hypothetical protein